MMMGERTFGDFGGFGLPFERLLNPNPLRSSSSTGAEVSTEVGDECVCGLAVKCGAERSEEGEDEGGRGSEFVIREKKKQTKKEATLPLLPSFLLRLCFPSRWGLT